MVRTKFLERPRNPQRFLNEIPSPRLVSIKEEGLHVIHYSIHFVELLSLNGSRSQYLHIENTRRTRTNFWITTSSSEIRFSITAIFDWTI